MENTNKTPETIIKYIDMGIVEFIDDLTNNKNFAIINGMIKLLDQEQVLLTSNREILAKSFATVKTNSKEFDEIFTQYVGSFVLEQKLIDRRDIAVHIRGIKGASNVLSPKPQTEPSKELIEASENIPSTSKENVQAQTSKKVSSVQAQTSKKVSEVYAQTSKKVSNVQAQSSSSEISGSNVSGGVMPKEINSSPDIVVSVSQAVNSKELAEQIMQNAKDDHRVTGYLGR